jgi:hypothetical protein
MSSDKPVHVDTPAPPHTDVAPRHVDENKAGVHLDTTTPHVDTKTSPHVDTAGAPPADSPSGASSSHADKSMWGIHTDIAAPEGEATE